MMKLLAEVGIIFRTSAMKLTARLDGLAEGKADPRGGHFTKPALTFWQAPPPDGAIEVRLAI
jgi:hypothetical protein